MKYFFRNIRKHFFFRGFICKLSFTFPKEKNNFVPSGGHFYTGLFENYWDNTTISLSKRRMLEKIDVNFKKDNQIIEQSNITKQLIVCLWQYINMSVVEVPGVGTNLEFKKLKAFSF